MARRSPVAPIGAALAGLALLAGSALQPAYAEPRSGPVLSAKDTTLLRDRTVPIAPGLNLTSFQRLQPGGWVTGHVMTADLSTPSLSLDVADGGEVSQSNAVVSEFAAETQAVAAVNGDYWDMNYSDAPIGTNISPTEGLRTAGAEARQAFTLSNGKAAVQALMSAATIELGGRTEKVGSVNSPTFAADSIGLFNQVWGTYPIDRLLTADETARIVTVVDGKVTANTTDRAVLKDTEIPEGTSILVARGAAGETLQDAAVGSVVDITVRASADVDLAIGGSQRLLTDGELTDDDQVTAGRTAVGVSKDGTQLHIVAIDGRAGDAHGMTIQELALFMQDLGAWNALNLDGGGSTTMVARPAGTTEPQLINRPSDGHERADANALVFHSSASKEQTTGVDVRAAMESPAGLTEPTTYDLLPGLSRTITATGLDEDYAATEVTGQFRAEPGSAVKLESSRTDGEAVVTGRERGTGAVTYRSRSHTDDVNFRVHGPMSRLEPSSTVAALTDGETPGSISLKAVDADGHRVPVEARDVKIDHEEGITVKPGSAGEFTITPTIDKGASSITFTVQEHELTVPVTIGFQEQNLADFADTADWKAEAIRAEGTLAAATGPEGGPALAMDFDFSQSTATRGMYAVPVEPIKITGQPQALTMWIKGTAKEEWPRIQVTKGDGTSTNLDGPEITWEGWQQVTFPVPAGTPFPLTVTALRFMETRSDATYTDHLELADLKAQVPMDIEQPDIPYVKDPVIMTQGTVADRPQRIAVMSDTQFVGREPDSDLVKAGRRTLQEIVAADPELLVINGDFVDEGAMIDFELAKRVLDEEVGDKIPYVYVPGNHEIMGGPITNFESIFGDTSTIRDIAGTRIITLDSSTGNLHPGGSTEQLRLLESQLDDATKDRSITGVLVFDHHPIDDPHPDKASQLTDRYEAAALERLLGEFRSRSGKSVAQINGHVGVFHADASSGVSRVINGNSGKGPSGTADHGGFTGWSMLGLDPAEGVLGTPPPAEARTAWLQVETHARVDALKLTAPTDLAVGDEDKAAAMVTQDDDHEVPVAWPVTAQWGGDGVWIDDGGTPDKTAVVAFDPTTRELRGLRAGTANLTVTVNGETAEHPITVT